MCSQAPSFSLAEVHLVSWVARAQSHLCFCLILRYAPQPDLHGLRERFGPLRCSRLSAPASDRWPRRPASSLPARRRRPTRPQPLPLDLPPLDGKNDGILDDVDVATPLDFFPPCCHCQPGGPVFDLSLHECSTRRKIAVRSLVQPVNVELQRPPQNVWHAPLQQLCQGVGGLPSPRLSFSFHQSSAGERVLRRCRVNYHSFNITRERLRQAMQVTVMFARPPGKPFPIMLLFR